MIVLVGNAQESEHRLKDCSAFIDSGKPRLVVRLSKMCNYDSGKTGTCCDWVFLNPNPMYWTFPPERRHWNGQAGRLRQGYGLSHRTYSGALPKRLSHNQVVRCFLSYLYIRLPERCLLYTSMVRALLSTPRQRHSAMTGTFRLYCMPDVSPVSYTHLSAGCVQQLAISERTKRSYRTAGCRVF